MNKLWKNLYTDTWPLTGDKTITAISFIMVFIIQHSQNRDTRAIHKKLDELIHQQQCTQWKK